MRILLGLAALAAVNVAGVSGQTVTPDAATTLTFAASPPIGTTARAIIDCQTAGGQACTVSPSTGINGGAELPTDNWSVTVPNSVTSLIFRFRTSQYTGQMQYRWSPNYPDPRVANPGFGLSATSYTCDPCAGGTPVSCNTAVGPGGTSPSSPVAGFRCANLDRRYTIVNLVASITNANPIVNSFSVQLFDINTFPAPNVSSYSFVIIRQAPPVVGDPQIFGIQGQDFQVHGVPDEIFNMITSPSLQVNARFVYLSEAECHDNFTACFAHPGTYISEEGIRLGNDKIHVKAGSFKKGLTVKINGQKITQKMNELKVGSVELLNHRRVVIKSPVAVVAISNSDKFLNQETQLLDAKLIELGKQRRKLLVGESFHPEVPIHGLQGQTWRNIEYPSGLDYEGTISDYQVTDGNLFGTHFVFNKFQL